MADTIGSYKSGLVTFKPNRVAGSEVASWSTIYNAGVRPTSLYRIYRSSAHIGSEAAAIERGCIDG